MIGNRPNGYRKGWRACTCHPDDAPIPCARLYALAECLAKSASAATAGPRSDDVPQDAHILTSNGHSDAEPSGEES